MIPYLSTTIEENSSSTIEDTSSIVESSLEESSSSSIVKTDFDADTKALFDSYFSFNIPFIDLEYDVVDETSEYGVPCVLIYFYDATVEDFNSYLDKYDVSFMFSGEGEYEGEYWYFYEKRIWRT